MDLFKTYIKLTREGLAYHTANMWKWKLITYLALKVIQYFKVDEFEPSKEHQIYQDKNKTICIMSLSVALKRAEVCSEICCKWGRLTGILLLGMIQEHLPAQASMMLQVSCIFVHLHLSFSIWPSKSHVSAQAKALFNLHTHCRKYFPFQRKRV